MGYKIINLKDIYSELGEQEVIVGYFAITNKVTNIKKVKLSETKKLLTVISWKFLDN